MPKVVPEYKEDAKRRIIEAAMDVIAERGCDQMTIDDVAKKLGVTKGAGEPGLQEQSRSPSQRYSTSFKAILNGQALNRSTTILSTKCLPISSSDSH